MDRQQPSCCGSRPARGPSDLAQVEKESYLVPCCSIFIPRDCCRSFFFNNFLFIHFYGCAGSLTLCRLSPVHESRATLRCSAKAAHCSGFSVAERGC